MSDPITKALHELGQRFFGPSHQQICFVCATPEQIRAWDGERFGDYGACDKCNASRTSADRAFKGKRVDLR